MLNGIIKRDGRVVMYDISKIKMAILKAMEADGKTDFAKAEEIAVNVENHFVSWYFVFYRQKRLKINVLAD